MHKYTKEFILRSTCWLLNEGKIIVIETRGSQEILYLDEEDKLFNSDSE